MKASSSAGGFPVPCIARWPGKIPAGHVHHSPATMLDLFPPSLKAVHIAPPSDRVIDGRDILPLFTSAAASLDEGILGQLDSNLPPLRDARRTVHVLPDQDPRAKRLESGANWVDSRAPAGVTLLAPFDQTKPGDHPGRTTGVAPAARQLFDFQADPAEPPDVAATHPETRGRVRKLYDQLTPDAPKTRKASPR